jgi:hypothetical protein
MLPSSSNQTLFRPSVVSSFASSSSTSFRAKALHAFSYVAAVFVFAAMLTEDFPVGSSGRHSLSGVQDTVRGFYEFAVTGSWPESIQHSDRRMDTEERRNTMNTTSQSNPKSQLR